MTPWSPAQLVPLHFLTYLPSQWHSTLDLPLPKIRSFWALRTPLCSPQCRLAESSLPGSPSGTIISVVQTWTPSLPRKLLTVQCSLPSKSHCLCCSNPGHFPYSVFHPVLSPTRRCAPEILPYEYVSSLSISPFPPHCHTSLHVSTVLLSPFTLIHTSLPSHHFSSSPKPPSSHHLYTVLPHHPITTTLLPLTSQRQSKLPLLFIQFSRLVSQLAYPHLFLSPSNPP